MALTMTSSIIFGDVNAWLDSDYHQCGRATVPTLQSVLKKTADCIVVQREAASNKAFAELDKKLATSLEVRKNATVLRDARTKILRLRTYTAEQTSAYLMRVEKRAAKAAIPDYDSIVSSINVDGALMCFTSRLMQVTPRLTIAGGPPPSEIADALPPVWKGVHALSKKKQKSTMKSVVMNSHQLESFSKKLRKLMHDKEMSFEIVGKRCNRGKYVQQGTKTYVQLETQHHNRKFTKRDIVLNAYNTLWVKFLSQVPHWKREENEMEVRPGCSGFVYNMDTFLGKPRGAKDGILIVRGLLHDRLLDARFKVHRSNIERIEHYTSIAEKFWKGFTTSYTGNRQTQDHECTSDFDVEKVGAMTALVWQIIAPSGKITCRTCARKYSEYTMEELRGRIEAKYTELHAKLGDEHADLLYPVKFVADYKRMVSAMNPNYESFSQVKQLIGDRTEAPFTHVNRVNAILAKGNAATQHELSEASTALLEVARYLNNRTENIQQGSLKHFRNKVSGKSKANMKLMCDNQLDPNGNFKWGKREYHAKRFFVNYLQVVHPERGYDGFEVRKTPDGTRKLAINNLIVSTNFDNIRQQLEGEPVGDMPLTDECVSRYLGQFKYPCCCVTHDDGTPQLSSVFMPIKNHLAIGNTGDSKYVDLPQAEGMEMYISKDGYCYINVFLAMLVNVNEDDAKEFTKMVRDVLIPKLGLWPSMMDLATACYYLTLFFPDTISAELPQILVDHKTKTLHVLDSYGSISTGYHILKADTIGQLNWFAHLKLDSAIKHYKVGGRLNGEQMAHTSHTETEEGLVRKLIRATYRPSELEKCLKEDPYLVVMALVSPSILLKLFTSGSLEWALANIAKRDMNLVHLYVLLKVLIEKVSVAKTLEMQSAIIGNQAHAIHGAINFSDLPGTHNAIIQQFLNKLIGHDEANKELRGIGFRDLHGSGREYIEKNFQQELRAAWLELTLVEKLQSIRFSQTWSTQLAKPSEREIVKDSTDKSAGSVGLSFGQIKRYTKERITRARQGVSEAIKRKKDQVNNAAWGLMVRFIPKALHIINVLLVLQIMISIAHITNKMLNEHKEHKVIVKQYHEDQQFEVLYRIFIMIEKQKGQRPTYEEYMAHLENHHPDLLPVANKYFANTEEIDLQAKSTGEAHLERVVAFVALVMMMFSPDRSDGVYRILNKLRGLVRIAEEPIELQGIDDINDILTEKKQTVDFELSDVTLHETNAVDKTFQQWWDHQIAHGFTVPHYTTEGKYMEFTRNTAEKVANEIAHSSERDFLIRGAVGSGKSTGLPFLLSKRGSVLIVEPTRPLAENVSKQLRGDPFYASPNLRMRGATAFGSSPITVMTSGYALHYLANNSDRIKDYNYFIFDECHVNDSNAMALRCLIHEYSGDHKVLKVSATPPGRMVQFETQHPVKLLEEEHLSFQQFVQNQGTSSNSDVTKHGDNILVYVASYNEVDTLSKLLLDKNHKVTKIDGRTMKVGGVEITTHGTSAKKHFIVATNIIENGVTLDIDVVVDFGVKVVPVLDSENRMIRYQKKNISYGERIQRLGRVGRNKPGTALKIGFTEKGPQEIPSMIATEAAFSCFAYGLPVMTGNVSTNLLSRCTVRQARAMMKFELSIFFMVGLVRFDGSMHAGIHDILKPFKLRESSMTLNKMAIPYGNSSQWLNARQYAHLGQHMDVAEDTKIPFYVKDIPEKVYESIWQTTMKYKGEAGFGRCISSNVSKIAYTLKTDPASIQRTVKTIDGLIAEERRKESYFQNATSQYCSFSEFSLSSITNAIKAHYSTNNTLENITILTEARDKLLHFWHSETQHADELWKDEDAFASRIQNNGVLENIVLQGRDEIATNLKLKGKWKKSLITRDILILAGVGIGGVWMLFEQFKHKWNESIDLQGKGKRQRQKLKFRQARDMKGHFQVHADDETLSHYYGEAYTKKGKKSGKVHGMGKKNKRFVNMYERDEDDFSMIRFVDPVSGKTIDEGMYYNMDLVQQQFGDYRQKLLEAERIQSHQKAQGIAAYLIKDFSSKALKVDLTPHNPLLVSNKSNNIMGYPEREFELRQTGPAIIVDPSSIPQENPIDEDEVMDLEGAGHINALRSYEPVSSIICYLNNETNGNPYKLFGIGFGSYIITSSHLFMHNNGILKIKSKHGDFEVRNTTQLLIRPLKDRDMILIKMPKDFPPFPQRVRFRQPQAHETACLVGALFQDKSIQSTVSGQSEVVQHTNKWMWKHWISTQKGQCGLPLVSTVDGSIIGIHTASSNKYNCNYFTSIPENFEQEFLHTDAHAEWCKHWRFNADHSMWSGLDIVNCKPEPIFRPTKEVSQLDLEGLLLQGQQGSWIQEHLRGNLMAVATSPSQLVTKHVVKGKCHLFEIYLSVNPQAKEYFTPMLGCYQKSALNREAYIKDITKYAETTRIGDVDTKVFFSAVEALKRMFGDLGFQECEYVTDEEAIFGALNLKSAVGALYSGKKKDYFEGFTGEDKAKIMEASCKRLFLGKMGLWNGSMKAELRPKEKVQLNKTRTFTAAPIDTLLGGKVCVDDFNNQFYSLNIKAPWAVGMTKFYGGWNELLMALPDGWVYCDADGSRFDSSLSPFLINAVLDIRSHFMEEWDIGEQMLRNLYTEIVYTPVLTPDSTIIKKCKGNNSGQPSTVVDNTMMVILAMIYSLEKLGVPYQQQHTMIRYFVTGDDLLIAIEPKFEVLLDSFEGHFSDLGLNYEFSARSRKREDLWFMSHKGLMREGIYIPKLEPERIVSILEWDRSREPIHRLEAICASMIEAWGYDDLVDEIRKFYAWVLEQAPYNELAKEGKAPYLAETALRNLYLGKEPTEKELERYAHIFEQADWDEDTPEEIELQGDDDMEGNDGVSNAGAASTSKDKQIAKQDKAIKDLDVNVGTRGTGLIPRVKMINQKLRVPKIKGGMAMDLDFLLTYKPAQDRITNAAATDEQFEQWYEKVREEYNLDEEQMKRVVNGLMVWCIENGTSPNINGVWVMMDGDEQVPFSLKPVVEYAKPTLRQIMARYSDVAEAYIAMRNTSEKYMPRYGLIRNLRNYNLARYAFDFYQVTPHTPDLAREIHHQMKAAALRGTSNRQLGFDGKVSTTAENTERHTADDVNNNTHSFQGAGQMW